MHATYDTNLVALFLYESGHLWSISARHVTRHRFTDPSPLLPSLLLLGLSDLEPSGWFRGLVHTDACSKHEEFLWTSPRIPWLWASETCALDT